MGIVSHFAKLRVLALTGENSMTKAMQIHELGGPEVMKWEDVKVGDPGEGEVRLKQSAAGLNYIDVYFREGIYPAPHMPFVPGMEGAGIVEAVGPDVTELAVGDQVAYASRPIGAYAEERLMPAHRLVKVPDSIGPEQAAGMMLKGMTASFLLQRVYKVKPGDTILFHAVAGGVGSIACQWAKHLGATVIGTVGSERKQELARKLGCDYPINYNTENFVERVKEITDGKGVPVVYDSVGAGTFTDSLDCLSPMGIMVSFGQASGKVPLFDIGQLTLKGSLFLTRPTLMTYIDKRQDLVDTANALFDVVANKHVRIDVKQVYPLMDAAKAHRDLEDRKTVGSTILKC
jgi:NADPH2:quinone reductase